MEKEFRIHRATKNWPAAPQPSSTYRELDHEVSTTVLLAITSHLAGHEYLKKIDWQNQLFKMQGKTPMLEKGLTYERVQFALNPVDYIDLVFLFSGTGLTEMKMIYQILRHLPQRITGVTFIDKSGKELAPAVKSALRDMGLPYREGVLSALKGIHDHTIVITFNPQLTGGTAADHEALQKILDVTKILTVYQKTGAVYFATTEAELFH